MKQTHIQTAVKALKRQADKYNAEAIKFEVMEKNARQSKDFFTSESIKIHDQIASLEGSAPKLDLEKELTAV